MAPPFEMGLATANVTAASGVPGEASHQDIPSDLMLAQYDDATGQIDLTYTPACDSTDHTVYYGDLSNVSSYNYADASCFLGTTGTAPFTPGTGSFFFVIVANNGTDEGSYGKDDGTLERPEAVGVGVCDMPQNLAGVICE
jgi:hypothetical protein